MFDFKKRFFDLFFATIGLIAASPLLFAFAILVRVSSPGPAFYRGRRVGRFNKPFRIFKFRSMVPTAEKIGGSSTADGDVRITQVGRFMRKCKLDELPQLLNVLRGDMSFVGPRPEVQEYVDMYTEEEKLILTLRPGITDWASIWNSDEGAILAGSDDPDKAYLEIIRPTKLKLQLKYAHENSFWVDCRIIAYTLLKLVKKDRLPAEIASYGKLKPAADSPPRKQAA